MRIPKLVAHRGYPLHYPENTLIGIKAAIESGAEFFEVDVQLTADHVPVLFHDRTLKRVCGIPGKIHEISLSRLTTLAASEPARFGDQFEQARIPTLVACGELLKSHPDVTGFIEVKRASIERFGVELVLDKVLEVLAPVAGQCVLISRSVGLLRLAHERQWHSLAVVIPRWQEREQAAIQAVQPKYLFCDVEDLPPSGKLGLEWAQLVIYEVTDTAKALELARRGVDFIETFAFRELITSLQGAFPQNEKSSSPTPDP